MRTQIKLAACWRIDACRTADCFAFLSAFFLHLFRFAAGPCHHSALAGAARASYADGSALFSPLYLFGRPRERYRLRVAFVTSLEGAGAAPLLLREPFYELNVTVNVRCACVWGGSLDAAASESTPWCYLVVLIALSGGWC